MTHGERLSLIVVLIVIYLYFLVHAISDWMEARKCTVKTIASITGYKEEWYYFRYKLRCRYYPIYEYDIEEMHFRVAARYSVAHCREELETDIEILCEKNGGDNFVRVDKKQSLGKFIRNYFVVPILVFCFIYLITTLI